MYTAYPGSDGFGAIQMPGLMSRVCGICPVSSVIASCKAGDGLLGVEPPPAAVLQRRLLNYAQVLQSHALSFFHLSSPDLLLGLDSPPEKRNLFVLVEREPDFIRRGIRLRQFGQRVIELAGGKRVHPVWGAPGGVLQPRQNNQAMNMAVEQAARRFVRPGQLSEGMLSRVEAAIRGSDPCLSCSTHAIGQMPLIVELRDKSGRVIERIERS